MKVSVITRHAITNYGSLLQAFATQTAIEKLGHECEIIDYIRDDESYWEHEKTLLKKKQAWNNSFIKRHIYLAIRQPESIWAGKKFENERNRYLKLSNTYCTRDSLNGNCPKADVYMTGSDQVWGPTEDGAFDSNYFLSFVDNSKKIAYAASFGHTKVDGESFASIKNYLSSYYKIAVREDSAVNLLHEMGIEAKRVLDPTLLFTKDFWNKYASTSCKNMTGKYVLIYQIHNDPKFSEYARKVAKKKNLKLVRISPAFHQISRPGRFKWCPSVSDFLAYIRDAELLITDSFHGTAFAINYNVPFVEILPNNNTGTRNVSILSFTRLSDRILIDNSKNIEDLPIDFTYANEVLRKNRDESLKILQEMIEG